MVGLGRLELPTSRLSSARSNQLSYRPGSRCQMTQEQDRRQRRRAARRPAVGQMPAPTCHPDIWHLTSGNGRDARAAPPSLSGRAIEGSDERLLTSVIRHLTSESLKGGDPAAGSPTATLLRLHPSRGPDRGRLPPLRVGAPASGRTNSHGVTGGVYKARERIHRGVLIRDY